MTIVFVSILFVVLFFILSVPRINSEILMYLLLAVPVINAFASVTTNYFPPGYYTPGAIRVALLMLVIVLLGGYIKKDWTTLFIFLFLFYVALLIPFS
jgi:hypothetical protein